jgi:hypothetical protein
MNSDPGAQMSGPVTYPTEVGGEIEREGGQAILTKEEGRDQVSHFQRDTKVSAECLYSRTWSGRGKGTDNGGKGADHCEPPFVGQTSGR